MPPSCLFQRGLRATHVGAGLVHIAHAGDGLGRGTDHRLPEEHEWDEGSRHTKQHYSHTLTLLLSIALALLSPQSRVTARGGLHQATDGRSVAGHTGLTPWAGLRGVAPDPGDTSHTCRWRVAAVHCCTWPRSASPASEAGIVKYARIT